MASFKNWETSVKGKIGIVISAGFEKAKSWITTPLFGDQSSNVSAKQEQAMRFFTDKGWSPEATSSSSDAGYVVSKSCERPMDKEGEASKGFPIVQPCNLNDGFLRCHPVALDYGNDADGLDAFQFIGPFLMAFLR